MFRKTFARLADAAAALENLWGKSFISFIRVGGLGSFASRTSAPVARLDGGRASTGAKCCSLEFMGSISKKPF